MKAIMTLLAGLAISASAKAGELSNYTPVISGKLSRAGSSQRQELSDASLKRLCEQGYTLAMFLYPGARARTVSCGGGKQIRYFSKVRYSRPEPILAEAEAEINRGGKVLVHCWYGVHGAKYVAAAALNKFCGWSGSQASSYFVRGIPPGSLAQKTIDELAAKLRTYPSGGSVTGGCPSP